MYLKDGGIRMDEAGFEAEAPQVAEPSMEELVRCMALSLVDEVSRIQITEIQGNQTHVIELKVAKEDIGKVIGRQGRTADAMRTIINCAAAKLSKRYILQIIDEEQP